MNFGILGFLGECTWILDIFDKFEAAGAKISTLFTQEPQDTKIHQNYPTYLIYLLSSNIDKLDKFGASGNPIKYIYIYIYSERN